MQYNLTARELSYLEDNLSREMLLVKKFKDYATQCQDPVLSEICEKIADKHAGHYDILLQYLTSEVKK